MLQTYPRDGRKKLLYSFLKRGKFTGSILFWKLLVWGLPVWRLMKIEKYVLVWGCSWEGECGLAQFDKNLRSETSSRSSPSPLTVDAVEQYIGEGEGIKSMKIFYEIFCPDLRHASPPPHSVVDATVWLQKRKEYKLLLRSQTSLAPPPPHCRSRLSSATEYAAQFKSSTQRAHYCKFRSETPSFRNIYKAFKTFFLLYHCMHVWFT